MVGRTFREKELDAEAHEVVCAKTPSPFVALGQAYRNFMQTTDEEVRALLRTDRAPGHTDRHVARAAGIPVIRLAIRPAG
jgi:predicted phosphoribosyltransferase